MVELYVRPTLQASEPSRFSHARVGLESSISQNLMERSKKSVPSRCEEGDRCWWPRWQRANERGFHDKITKIRKQIQRFCSNAMDGGAPMSTTDIANASERAVEVFKLASSKAKVAPS